MVRLRTKNFPGVSFLVDKSFECENASENAAARFVQPGWLIVLALALVLLRIAVTHDEMTS